MRTSLYGDLDPPALDIWILSIRYLGMASLLACALPMFGLRLCSEWSTLDPHQKTILSGDWGVGFTTWFLGQTLGFINYSDTLWVLKALKPGELNLGQSKKRGPKKSPDYIAEDGAGNYSVLECKGSQASRSSLRAAIARGIPQKENLTAGATSIVHSLVAGLFVPQFESAERPLLMIADPEPDGIRKEVFRFSRQQIGRGVTQVALAKELSLLEMPETASYLVGERARHSSVGGAVAADSTRQRLDRTITANGLAIHRDYVWERPTFIAEDHTVVGIRFIAMKPALELERLVEAESAEELAEEIHHQPNRAAHWIPTLGSESVDLSSPFGTRYRLELLEG